jgi:hypothetical protein
MLLWSERRGAQLREVAADLGTILWLFIWINIGWRLYELLAELAGAGRLIRDGGVRLGNLGEQIARLFEGIPFVGEGAADRIRSAFSATAEPVITFGSDLERLLIIIAALLGLIVVALALTPWLTRYLPWRLARWRRLNAGARAIRRGKLIRHGVVGQVEIEQVLASRALHRLEYDELLEFTPDPIGDWTSGRLERLVQAELDDVGLARTAAKR